MIFKEDTKRCIYRGYLHPGAPTTNQPHDLMFSSLLTEDRATHVLKT